MKNRVLAVCDSEEVYVCRLAEYLNGKQVNPFHVRAFTSKETLEEYAQQEEVEILLIAADLAEQGMQNLQAGKKIVLTSGTVSEELREMPAIYKYQSAEKIIREILYYYAEEAQPFLQAAILKGTVRLYGVYSPVHRIGKTTFALALGTVCARRRRTLYLNLEAYAGFEQRIPSAQSWNLGDLLYFLKKGKLGFLYKLKSVTNTIGELDYVSPVLTPDDLLSVTEEDWETLLERLISDADYECLILDFSDCIQGLPELLEKCGRIYMPVLEDRAARAKVEQFEQALMVRGYEGLKDSIQKIKLPRVPVTEGLDGTFEIPEEICSFAEELEGW